MKKTEEVNIFLSHIYLRNKYCISKMISPFKIKKN
jgi:hypothetical protein